MDEPTTTQLVERARDGDDGAWAALVRRFANVIWAASASFAFDRDTRDDVFQMTCLRLLDHLDAVREPERLAGWLAVTARRECLAVVRDRSRWLAHDDFDDVLSAAPDVDHEMQRNETISAVAEALDEIDAPCRELLRLLVSDPPLSYETIAEILGRPIGSIGPTRARCLEKLGRRPAIVRITDGPASSEPQEVRGE